MPPPGESSRPYVDSAPGSPEEDVFRLPSGERIRDEVLMDRDLADDIAAGRVLWVPGGQGRREMRRIPVPRTAAGTHPEEDEPDHDNAPGTASGTAYGAADFIDAVSSSSSDTMHWDMPMDVDNE